MRYNNYINYNIANYNCYDKTVNNHVPPEGALKFKQTILLWV